MKAWLKPAVFVACVVPAARLGWRFWMGKLGANPIAEAENTLGLWTLILLLATLSCSVFKITLGWTWPLRVRRMLGLFAFFYVCLHFGMYVGVDQFFDGSEIWKDIAKRKFITVGFASFVLLVPLAVTSTNRWVKRLGVRRWKRLHRLVYVAAVGGVVHFMWRVKSDLRQPLVYAAVLAFLLAVRLWDRVPLRPAGSPPAR
jgi:methionine sulfoxide reductase heme-binding subunit